MRSRRSPPPRVEWMETSAFTCSHLSPSAAGELSAGLGSPVFGIVAVQVQSSDPIFVVFPVPLVVQSLLHDNLPVPLAIRDRFHQPAAGFPRIQYRVSLTFTRSPTHPRIKRRIASCFKDFRRGSIESIGGTINERRGRMNRSRDFFIPERGQGVLFGTKTFTRLWTGLT